MHGHLILNLHYSLYKLIFFQKIFFYFFLCLVGLMTLSGPDAEALFQSLIRDDPSAVGVVDTTTPPPSIQPTSSLESTTQEQR